MPEALEPTMDEAESQPAVPPAPPSPFLPPGADEPPRRGFFKKALAVLIGGLLMAVPAAAGLLVWLDPLRRQRRGGAAAGATFLTITRLDALPDDGLPRKFRVIADRSDAWNKYPNVPVGAIYLRREKGAVGSPGRVQALNVVCPHAGCFVDAKPDGHFHCPCHNSGFTADGSLAPGSVSPRPMDELEVDAEALKQGVVRVKFQNFIAGTHEKIPVS